MGQIEQVVLLLTGLLMLVVALGELGLIRRLLPDVRLTASSTHEPGGPSSGNWYRRVAIVGATAAATFGITCNKPLYVLLLTYVALVGGMGYGVLALGAYGLGLASSIALGGLVLRPASRSARLARWLGARQETFHLVQGAVFAFMGGVVASFFWLRMGAYIPPA